MDENSNSIIDEMNNDSISIESGLMTYIYDYMDYNDYTNDDLQYTYGYIVNVNGEVRHYINDNLGYYLESEGLTDRYIQCANCGGFTPVGDITNPLPKAAICHCNSLGGLLENYKDFTVSRDEAYNWWVENGMPVYDEDHLNNFTNRQFDGAYAIYCKDCGGFVILKNYDMHKEYSSYFINHGDSVLNIHICGQGVINESIVCSHYNGSLDIFDAPVEEFYPGWFISTDEYNTWLNKVTTVLNENSTQSIENDTTLDESVNGTIDSYPHEGSENYSDMDDFRIDGIVFIDELDFSDNQDYLVWSDGEDYLCS